VSSFQRQAGLKADRIIGLKTLLALQAKNLKDRGNINIPQDLALDEGA
jgi:murein L,D-transpeptidase YcbB/YkuD